MRRIKIAIIVFVIIAVLSFSMAWAAWHWIESFVTNKIEESLSVGFEVGSLEIGIIGGRLSLHEVKLKNPRGYEGEYMATAKDIYLNISLLSLLSGRVGIDSVIINEPVLSVEKIGSRVNTSGILVKSELGGLGESSINLSAKGTEKSFYIKSLRVTGGEVAYSDARLKRMRARIQLEKVNANIVNIAYPAPSGELLTRIKVEGTLYPSGAFSIEGRGNFAPKKATFDLDTTIRNAYLPYFYSIYVTNPTAHIKNGYININSQAECRENELLADQYVELEDLQITAMPGYDEPYILGLPAADVVNYFRNSRGRVVFDFQIKGSLDDPKFDFGPTIQRLFIASVSKRVAQSLSDLTQKTLEKGWQGGSDAGERVGPLKDRVEQMGEEVKEGILDLIDRIGN